MSSRVSLQPAFILHAQPFRDTSYRVDVLSRDHGRISGIIRGARSRKSPLKGLVRPFVPLLMSWSGKTELLSINKVEPAGDFYLLTGKVVISAFYLNELLMRLLHRYDPHPEIYNAYARALLIFHKTPDRLQPALREFEFNLLKALGFGLQLNKTYDTQEAVVPQGLYQVRPEYGVKSLTAQKGEACAWLGRSLIAIEARDFSHPQTLRDAKRLIRLLLPSLLGRKALKSYECLV